MLTPAENEWLVVRPLFTTGSPQAMARIASELHGRVQSLARDPALCNWWAAAPRPVLALEFSFVGREHTSTLARMDEKERQLWDVKDRVTRARNEVRVRRKLDCDEYLRSDSDDLQGLIERDLLAAIEQAARALKLPSPVSATEG